MTDAFKPVTIRSVAFGELPEVTLTTDGDYAAGSTRYAPEHYYLIDTDIRELLALKLRMEADAKEAEGAKLTQQIKEAADFRANQARIEAENKAAAAKKAHDDLRTSPIALKALALYNKGCIRPSYPYKTWDATNEGYGSSDEQVHYYIGQVEAKEMEAAEKLAARRDALAKELSDGTSIGPWYEAMGTVHKRAIDRIIELEDAK